MLSSQDWAPAPSKYILCWLAAPSRYLHSTNLAFVFEVSQCGFHFKLKWQRLFLHRMPLFVNQVCTTDSCAGLCYFLVPKELLCWVSVFLLFSLVLSWALLCSVSEQQMQIVLRIRVKFCWSCAFTTGQSGSLTTKLTHKTACQPQPPRTRLAPSRGGLQLSEMVLTELIFKEFTF